MRDRTLYEDYLRHYEQPKRYDRKSDNHYLELEERMDENDTFGVGVGEDESE